MGIEATTVTDRCACTHTDPEPETIFEPASLDLAGLSVRDRLREALTCPWCRDDVERGATSVVCSRDGCGALYHAECWDDCRALHGACAVFGCDATEAEAVTHLGYLLRLVSLLIAAILLPPRVLRAAHRLEEEGFGAVFERARALVAPCFLSLDPGENSFTKLFCYAFAALPLSGLLLRCLAFPGAEVLAILALPVLVGLITILGPPILGGLILFGYALSATLVRALRSELGALGRVASAPTTDLK